MLSFLTASSAALRILHTSHIGEGHRRATGNNCHT